MKIEIGNVNPWWPAFGVAAFLLLFSPARCLASIYLGPTPNVGQAGGYTVFGLNVTMDITGGGSTIVGNVGVGANGALSLGGNSTVTGTVFKDPTATVTVGGGSTISGGQVTQNMTPAYNDALGAAAAFAAAAPDQTISGNVSGSTAFTTAGGTKIIDITGNVALGGSSIMSFTGNASDYYIVNVGGSFALGGTASISLSGGMTAQNLIFNIEYNNSGQNGLMLASGTHSFGTFLAPFTEVALDGGSSANPVLTGAVIGDGNNMNIQSTAWITGFPIPAVPEPCTLALAGLSGLSLLLFRRQRK